MKLTYWKTMIKPENMQQLTKLNFKTFKQCCQKSLNKKLPNFWKPQKTYIKAIFKSQKTFPTVKNIYIKALKFMLKTSLERFL